MVKFYFQTKTVCFRNTSSDQVVWKVVLPWSCKCGLLSCKFTYVWLIYLHIALLTLVKGELQLSRRQIIVYMLVMVSDDWMISRFEFNLHFATTFEYSFEKDHLRNILTSFNFRLCFRGIFLILRLYWLVQLEC